MLWRTSYRASMREAAIHGAMRRRSIHRLVGDPERSGVSIPYDIRLGVIDSFVFMCNLIRIQSLINVINS